MDRRSRLVTGVAMRTPAIISALLIAATGTWTLVLGRGLPARDDSAIILIALSLWVATVASVTGMLVVRGRWARRLGLAVTGGHALVSLVAPTDAFWGAAAVLSAGTAVAIAGPWLDGHIRARPAASGPPTRAVLVPLILVSVPLAAGLTGGGGVIGLVVGWGALVAAYWFIRVLPGALVVVRVVWPAFALATAWPLGWPAGAVVVALSGVVTVIAWHSSIRASVVSLVERGSVVPIPPELAPPEILDAADIDDRGRPR